MLRPIYDNVIKPGISSIRPALEDKAKDLLEKLPELALEKGKQWGQKLLSGNPATEAELVEELGEDAALAATL